MNRGEFDRLSTARLRGRVGQRIEFFRHRFGQDGLLAEELIRYDLLVEDFLSSDWADFVEDHILNGELVICHGDAHLGVEGRFGSAG